MTVELTVAGKTIPAQIVLGSRNGKSLMLGFDDAVRVGGGMVIGMLPVLQQDDGTWIEIIGGSRVEVKIHDEK